MRAAKLLAVALPLLLAGCGEDDPAKPYLEIAGGGFIVNYRVADSYYGFVAKPVRALPEGAVIEVTFELPGKGKFETIREPARAGQLQYLFRTQSLTGIERGHRYKMAMRLIDASGKELGAYGKEFPADFDVSLIPEKPLVDGPGYTPNP